MKPNPKQFATERSKSKVAVNCVVDAPNRPVSSNEQSIKSFYGLEPANNQQRRAIEEMLEAIKQNRSSKRPLKW